MGTTAQRPEDLALWGEYQQQSNQGEFLANHPRFAQNLQALGYAQPTGIPATAEANPPMSHNALLDDYTAAADKDQFLTNHPEFAANHPELATIGGVAWPKAQTALGADLAAGQAEATQNISQSNPQYNTDFGSSNVTFDENGNPVYTETMSPEQKALLDQQQALSNQGMVTASGLLHGIGGAGDVDPSTLLPTYENEAGNVPKWQTSAGYVPEFEDTEAAKLKNYSGGMGSSAVSNELVKDYEKFAPGSPEEMRAKVEDAVYDKLTRDLDQNYQVEKDAKAQELFNKGIPYSNDPNSRYQRELTDIDKRFDRAKEEARQTAITMGGQEAERQFGMELQTHQAGMDDLGKFIDISQTSHAAVADDIKARFGMNLETSKLQTDQQGQQFLQDKETILTKADLQQQLYDQGYKDTEIKAYLAKVGFDMSQEAENADVANTVALTGLGTGAIQPNLPGYQAPPATEITIPSEYKLALKQLGLTDKEIEQQWKIEQLRAKTDIQVAQINAAGEDDEETSPNEQ